MEIEDIINKYGWIGRTGRVIFPNYAYILVSKQLGLNWSDLTHSQKIQLKGQMIDQFAGTWEIQEDYWRNLNKVK